MSVTVPVPYPGTSITQQLLNDLRTRGAFIGMQVYASLVEHGTANGFPSYKRNPSGASRKPKYFTSYSNIGVFIDGSLPMDGQYSSSFSDPSFWIYSNRLAGFYRERIIADDEQFVKLGIPRLVIREFDDPEYMNFDLDDGKGVMDLQSRMVTTAEQPWPFGTIFPDETGPIEIGGVKYRATFPSNHGLKFNLATGLPEIFHYEEYNRANPLETVVRVKGKGGTVSGSIQVKAGINLRNSLFPLMMQPNLTDSEFNNAVINLLEVK